MIPLGIEKRCFRCVQLSRELLHPDILPFAMERADCGRVTGERAIREGIDEEDSGHIAPDTSASLLPAIFLYPLVSKKQGIIMMDPAGTRPAHMKMHGTNRPQTPYTHDEPRLQRIDIIDNRFSMTPGSQEEA